MILEIAIGVVLGFVFIGLLSTFAHSLAFLFKWALKLILILAVVAGVIKLAEYLYKDPEQILVVFMIVFFIMIYALGGYMLNRRARGLSVINGIKKLFIKIVPALTVESKLKKIRVIQELELTDVNKLSKILDYATRNFLELYSEFVSDIEEQLGKYIAAGIIAIEEMEPSSPLRRSVEIRNPNTAITSALVARVVLVIQPKKVTDADYHFEVYKPGNSSPVEVVTSKQVVKQVEKVLVKVFKHSPELLVKLDQQSKHEPTI